ncbi:MAG: hypothetical protein C4293_00595 [Nitrospiraceae bacterium]
MKKTKFHVGRAAAVLHQVEPGGPVAEIIWKLEISEQTCSSWYKKYGQLGVAEIRRLRQLKEESRKLKQLVAGLTPDNLILARPRFSYQRLHVTLQ